MDVLELLLAICLIILLVGLSFYIGFRTAKNKFIFDSVAHTFDQLEREDHIRTKMDADGEKDLIPISQVVAEALEEDRAARSQK
jgi:hypothetical protein